MEKSSNKKDYSISMLKAQSASLPFGLIAVVETGVFAGTHSMTPIVDAIDILLPWYFFPVFLGGIIVHEAIHVATWMIAGRLPYSTMKFGFQWKTITPYAHCTTPISKRAYVIGTVMPAVVLGIVPFTASLYIGNGWLLLFGVLFTFAAIGDFLII